MFRIGEFSKLSNITVKMLRHYDSLDLLKPEVTDQESNYRYYSAEQLTAASQINLYKSMGFSLKEIKLLLQEEAEAGGLQAYFDAKETELSEELDQLQKKRALLEKISKDKPGKQDVPYHAIKKTVPQRLVLSLRKKLASYNDEGSLWNELYAVIQEYQLEPVYDGYTMAIYHDEDFREDEADIELQVTIAQEKAIAGSCKILLTEEMPVISVTFAGSYQQMPKVNQALAFWLEHEHSQLAGPMINIFHVSPAQTANEAEYVTEACYVIKEK